MNQIYLRKAEWKDVDLLFEWANDREVRINSFNTAPIEYEEHKRWFKNCLQDENVAIYICYFNTQPIGQVRLNCNNETAVISYSIAKKYRGRGFGKFIIKLIEDEVISMWPNVKVLFGSVKLNNIASQRIFEHNGYRKKVKEESEKIIDYYKTINTRKRQK